MGPVRTNDRSDLHAAHDALRASEARFRAAFEENPETIGIYRPILDERGRFVDAELLYENRTGRERYFGGLDLDQLAGAHQFERWPESRPLLFGLFAGFVEGHGPDRGELHGVRADGEYWSEVSLFRFDDGFVLVGRDVTESIRARLERQEAEQRSRLVLDSLPDAVVILRPLRDGAGAVADLVCEYINQAALTGDVAPAQLVGSRMLTLWPDARTTGLFDAAIRVLLTGEPLTLDGQSFSDPFRSGSPPRLLDLRVRRVGDTLVGSWRDVTDARAAIDALAASEDRYAQLVSGIPVGVYRARSTADGRARWEYVSPQAGRILDREPASLVRDPRPVYEAIHPDDRAALLEANIAGYRDRAPIAWEGRFAIRDGWRVIRIASEPGPRIGDEQVWHGFMEDVTEQRRTTDALHASEARYAQLVEGISLGVFRARAGPAGEMLFDYLSPQAGRVLGVDPAAAERDPMIVFSGIHPDDVGEVARRNAASYQARSPFEWEGRCFVHGEERIVRVASEPTDQPGGDLLWHGFIEDVTEQRRTAAALHESEERYRLLAENANDVVWTMGADGRITDVSPAVERLRGITPEQAMAQPIDQTHPPASRALVEGYVRELLADVEAGRAPRPFLGELEYLHADGGTVWCEVRVIPRLGADGRVFELLGLSRDISERKRHEQAQRRFGEELERRVVERTRELEAANEELRSFSYSVSHDLRAPVRAVAGFARILQRDHGDRLDADGLHNLDNIVTAGHAMGRLIDDLLAYTRVGQGALTIAPIPLAPVIEALRVALAARLAEAGGTLEAEEPLATPVGDRSLLDRILLNLVDNALEYHQPDLPPRVRLSSTRAGDTVTIAVADNGIGIPADAWERIFDVFTRLAPGGEDTRSGIGLATVRRAARAMGTEVTVDSVVGRGTTFRFSLPAAAG